MSFAKSCCNGHLEIAQWFYNSSNFININTKNAFKLSCRHNHLEVARWLTTICDKYQLTISGDKIISHDP